MKEHLEQHEPYCPLFKNAQNFTMNDRSAATEKKMTKPHNKTNSKSLQITSDLANELVDKYFND